MAEHEIYTELTVKKPSNKMSALFEVVAPPIVTSTLNPIKDSFTRQGNGYDTLNYGSSNSFVVGKINEVYRTFIQFDLSTLSQQYILIESKLRLYYTGKFDDTIQIEAYTVDKSWQENSITNSNRPSPTSLIIDKYTVNKSFQYVEFDFLDIVNKWYKNSINNEGFMLRIKNETITSNANFRSRESTSPPELVTSYYDTQVYSTGRSQVLTELFVWNTGVKDVLTEVTVGSVVRNHDVPTQLYVHRVDTPVESDKATIITATRPDTLTQLDVAIRMVDEVLTELEVRSDITHGIKDTLITVTRPDILTEIYVRERNSIDVEIEVIGKPNNDVLSEIIVSREAILTEIGVKYRYDLETEITVSLSDEDYIPTELSVSREVILTEIGVKYTDDVPTQINVRALDLSDKNTEIAVSREAILTQITVMESSTVPTEIFVKYVNVIPTEITVQQHSSILTEITVFQKSEIPTELTVSVPKILTSVTVPYRDSHEILTTISPRVLRVESVEIEITVKRIVGAYAFII